MSTFRLQNATDVMKIPPAGKWNTGRPLQRFTECYIETGAVHKAWEHDDDDDDCAIYLVLDF
jgi:hypothetical protein